MEKLKKTLYSLYILHTYETDENPSKLELNSLMINSIDTIDNNIHNKEQLIKQVINLLKSKIENQSLFINQTFNFKIGDVIKTSSSSANINLKFVFLTNNNKVQIDVFEKGNFSLTIKL